MKNLIAFLILLVFCSCSTSQRNAQVVETKTEAEAPDDANAWVEVDTLQFSRNLDYLRHIMGPKVKICVVMKGDAYGNGISVLMPVIINKGIDNVAITSNQEARDVRASGYKGSILRIRIATEDEIREAIDLGIDEMIGGLHQAEYIDRIAGEMGKTVNFHLAVNANGMSRNGIELSEGYDEALDILKLPHLHCVGMMTHYPENKDGAIVQQLERFKSQTAELIRRSGLRRSDLTLHTAATYSALYVPETRLDMVRIGSALYHYGYTDRFSQFKNITAFKSRVASVQTYPAGNTVSYKRTHQLSRDSRLANIPVGYANGISTEMANKGYMLIRGHRCPVVGNVTMNITMVDVTDYPDVTEGDEVVIYGRQGSAEITPDDISSWTGVNLLSQSLFWSAANPKRIKP